MVDLHPHGADDVQIVIHHQIVYPLYGAGGAVFNRQYAVFAHAGFDGGEHAVKGGEVQNRGDLEHLGCGDLGVRTLHALAGDPCLFGEQLGGGFPCVFDDRGVLALGGQLFVLIGSAQGQNGGVEHHGIFVQILPCLSGNIRKQFPLTGGIQHGQAVFSLVFRHIAGHLHAAQEKIQHLPVDFVDLFSQFHKIHDSYLDIIKASDPAARPE